MVQQLTFDFLESDQLPFAAVVDNFFSVGFESKMLASVAVKNNRSEMKTFAKDKCIHLFLPLRSRPFAVKAFGDGLRFTPDGLSKLALPNSDRYTSLSQFGNVFTINNTKEDIPWGVFFDPTKSSTFTLDCIEVDGCNKNELIVNMFISRRECYGNAKTQKTNFGRKEIMRVPTADLKSARTSFKFVISLIYNIKDGLLVLHKDSLLYAYDTLTGQKEQYDIIENKKGSGLAFLYNFFCVEKMGCFFSAESISPTTTSTYIDAVKSAFETTFARYCKIKGHPAPGYFEGVIFQQAMSSMFIKDLFTNTNALLPVFVNSLRYTGEITPFSNIYQDATLQNILISNAGSALVEDPHLHEFYPSSKWALKKTAEFWKMQGQFFLGDEGYLALSSLLDVVRILRHIHKFYCIYHKHFSDQLDEVDKIYSMYYLRYIVYDYDLIHFAQTRAADRRHIHIENAYSEYIINAFYKNAAIVGPYMSNTKMRRFFIDFFQSYNMFGGENKYNSVDGHIHATLLSNYNYLVDFEQLFLNMYAHPETKDVYKQEVPWKDYTSLRQVHDAVAAYMARHKHMGKPRTNKLYDVFEKADLKIPGTTLELRFARHTGEIKSWGEEQAHCIGTYADRLNDGGYLLFGVWDNSTKKWFGHCMMNATDELKKTSNKKFWDETPNFWKEYQFLGQRNSSLNANEKRKVIEHLLGILYPKKPKEEVKTEEEKVIVMDGQEMVLAT